MDYFILFLFVIFVVIITLAILLAVYTKKKDKKKTKILSIALALCSSLLLLLILIYVVLKFYRSSNKTKRYEYADVTVGASSAITPVHQLNSFESPHDTSVSSVVTPIYQIPSKSSDEKEAFEGVSFIDTAKYPRFEERDDIPPTEVVSRKDANPIQPDNTTEIKSLQTLDQYPTVGPIEQQVAQPRNEDQKQRRRERNRKKIKTVLQELQKVEEENVGEEKVEEEKVGEEKVESVLTVRKREEPKPTKTPNPTTSSVFEVAPALENPDLVSTGTYDVFDMRVQRAARKNRGKVSDEQPLVEEQRSEIGKSENEIPKGRETSKKYGGKGIAQTEESIPEQTQESIPEQTEEIDVWLDYLKRMLTLNDLQQNRYKTENKNINRKGISSSSLHETLDDLAPETKGVKRQYRKSRKLRENNTQGDASVEQTTGERQ